MTVYGRDLQLTAVIQQNKDMKLQQPLIVKHCLIKHKGRMTLAHTGSYKCTVNVKRSPYNRPPRAQRGSRSIALLILDLGARRGWVVSTTPPAALPLGKTWYPLYRWLGGPRAGLDVCEKSRPTGIRSPDHPACSKSLYRLSYPAHTVNVLNYYNLHDTRYFPH
jgi:hypothetical protein